VAGDKDQRTEQATPKRRKEARQQGQIPRTQEISAWAQVLVAVVLLKLAVSGGTTMSRELLEQAAQVMAGPPDPGAALRLLGSGMGAMLKVLLPIALGMTAVGVAGQLAQVGFAPSLKVLKPKLERLNPLKGAKRLFSPLSAWEAGKQLIKLAVLGELARRAMFDLVPKVAQGGGLAVQEMVVLTADALLVFVRNVALAGLVLGFVDYALQRRKMAGSLRMTKQEVKEEAKQSEGNPLIKGAIRSKQLQMSRQRMIAEVMGADVVITNPTQLALALKYNPARGAPRVVAKGAGAVAARIRAEADKGRVPIVEDVPLARTLYRACDLGDEIPAELYEAVARVLAFVFALKRKGTAAGRHRTASGLAEELKLPRPRRRRARTRA
jgi:flagellar biosynthetic protein FlhB